MEDCCKAASFAKAKVEGATSPILYILMWRRVGVEDAYG